MSCSCADAVIYRKLGLAGGAAANPAPGSAGGAKVKEDEKMPAVKQPMTAPPTETKTVVAAAATKTAFKPHSIFTGEISGLTAEEVAAILDKAVRRPVTKMADSVAKKDSYSPAHCYYLRSPPRETLAVDHTFECQLMGHAIVQTDSWRALCKQDGFIGDQVGVVLKKSLDEVAEVQNQLANLHLLDSGINSSKRFVYTEAIHKMRTDKAAGRGDFDLQRELIKRCGRHFSETHPEHDFPETAEVVGGKLFDSFEASFNPMTGGLVLDRDRPSWSAADEKKQAMRMHDLQESVVQLYHDLGC
jgi:hypothetical protein